MFVYNIVIIGFVISPAVSSAVRNLASTSTCRASEFTCLDGTCIRADAVCDTYWDCPDGSDETPCYSRTNSNLAEATVSPERYKRQSPCGLDKWQCRDGTCIAVGARCDGKADCPDGSDENYCLDKKLLNQTIQSSIEKAINAAFGSPPPGPSPPLRSGEDEQSGSCRLDLDVSVHYYCQIPTTSVYRICNQFVPWGTLVKPECNAPNYFYSRDLLPTMTCQSDGKWNRIIKCEPECGRITPDAGPLIYGGTQADRGELPWHVAVYREPTKKRNYYEQICGGSIVANSFVLSAAHCFWNNGKGEKHAASNFAVATGKLFREWDHIDDKNAQKSKLKSITIPPRYRGALTNHQHDLAVLNLETPFVYYTYVRPVCLNFNYNVNMRQLQEGNFGKFAGWGLTAENGSDASVLKVVQLPYVPVEKCIRVMPLTFKENINGDKICAGYDNGTAAVCKGDSGGGLVFPGTTSDGITRHYLRGIASTAPKNSKKCNIYALTAFTEIYQHEHFIYDVYASVALNVVLKTYMTEFIRSIIASNNTTHTN